MWETHAEKAARLLTKCGKIPIQGCMTDPMWKDDQTSATRYRAEIAAQTLDYQGAGNQALLQSDQPAVEVSMHQPAEAVVPAEEPAKPKRSRRICRDLIVDVIA